MINIGYKYYQIFSKINNLKYFGILYYEIYDIFLKCITFYDIFFKILQYNSSKGNTS